MRCDRESSAAADPPSHVIQRGGSLGDGKPAAAASASAMARRVSGSSSHTL
jgi:hypothetical protein